jgi:diguanylate cyclase (GGDEF)-like protein
MVRMLIEPRITALLLSVVAAAIAAVRVAVLEARLRSLREQAVTDPLTGAFNRRQMYIALSAAVERRHRAGERASILLVDVDRFKDVNDAFGHAEGDRVLKALVTLVSQRFRKLDFLFRAGGEEFLLLLSGTRFADAFAVAEELRALVIDAELVPEWQLSISVGVAELALGDTVDGWLEEADAALYRAKRAGRNRVAGRSAGTREPVAAAAARLPVRIS